MLFVLLRRKYSLEKEWQTLAPARISAYNTSSCKNGINGGVDGSFVFVFPFVTFSPSFFSLFLSFTCDATIYIYIYKIYLFYLLVVFTFFCPLGNLFIYLLHIYILLIACFLERQRGVRDLCQISFQIVRIFVLGFGIILRSHLEDRNGFAILLFGILYSTF